MDLRRLSFPSTGLFLRTFLGAMVGSISRTTRSGFSALILAPSTAHFFRYAFLTSVIFEPMVS